MKNVIFLFALIIGTQTIAQQSIQWEKSFGGTARELGNRVLSTQDGGLLVASYSESNNIDVSGNHGNGDSWLLKLNAAGDKQWQKCYGGLGFDGPGYLAHGVSGGYIMAGSTGSNGPKEFDQVFGNHGDRDIWVVKIGELGEIQWRKTYGGCGRDEVRDIIKTADGNYCVIGGTMSDNSGDVYGAHGDWDAWVIKISASGELLWQKTLGGSGIDYLYSVAETSQGDLIVGGLSSSNDGDLNGQINRGIEDYWIAKLSSNGSIIWSKNYGGSNYDGVRSLCLANNGDIVATGVTYSYDGDVSGQHGSQDIWVLRIDSNGNLLWQKVFGGFWAESGYSVFQRSDNNFIVVGETTSSDGDVVGNHGDQDIWVIKFDGNGTLKTQLCLGGSEFDFARNAILGAGQQIIIGGTSNSNNGDVSNNIGGDDTWIVKLNFTLGLKPETPDAAGFGLTVTPNPARDLISLSTNLKGEKQVRIFDEIGALIQTINMDELTMDIQLGQIPAGNYVVSMFTKSGQVVSTRFVKE